jgi:hypothetical protein
VVLLPPPRAAVEFTALNPATTSLFESVDLAARLESYRRRYCSGTSMRRFRGLRLHTSSFRFAHLISPPASPAPRPIQYPYNEGAFPSRCEDPLLRGGALNQPSHHFGPPPQLLDRDQVPHEPADDFAGTASAANAPKPGCGWSALSVRDLAFGFWGGLQKAFGSTEGLSLSAQRSLTSSVALTSARFLRPPTRRPKSRLTFLVTTCAI